MLIPFGRHIYIFFSKIKGHKEVTKKSRFFYNFLLVDGRIQEAQKHTDPHTEHCMKV